MKLPRTITYETPEGEFAGTITAVTLNDDDRNGIIRENLRLTIAVDPISGDPVHDFRVRADYWGMKADRLLPDLYRILGPDVVHLTDVEGNIIPERLAVLEGTRVRFNVIHCPKPGFRTPFRRVVNLRPLTLAYSLPDPQLKRAA